MAKKGKKDLDPKGRSSKVRGGSLPDERKQLGLSAELLKEPVKGPMITLPKKDIRPNPI